MQIPRWENNEPCRKMSEKRRERGRRNKGREGIKASLGSGGCCCFAKKKKEKKRNKAYTGLYITQDTHTHTHTQNMDRHDHRPQQHQWSLCPFIESWFDSRANLLFIPIIGPCYVSLSSLFVDPHTHTHTHTHTQTHTVTRTDTPCLCDTKRIEKAPETVSAWKASPPNGSCIQPDPPADLPYIDRAEWWRALSKYETEQCDTVLTLLPEWHTPTDAVQGGNFPPSKCRDDVIKATWSYI